MEAGSRLPHLPWLLPCLQGGGEGEGGGGGGGGEEESMRVVFREGIELAINFCRGVQLNVNYGYLGSEPYIRIHDLCDRIFSCFIQSKHPPTKIALKELLRSFLPSLLCESIEEVCDELLAMYQECLRGDFTSIQLIKEADARRQMLKQVNNFQIQDSPDIEKIKKDNHTLYDIEDPYARRVFALKRAKLHYMQEKEQRLARESSALKNADPSQTPLLIQEEKAVCKFGTETPSVEIIKEPNIICLKANLSEMDGSRVLQGDLMRVFKEGVNLFSVDLWHHFGIEERCGSNPTPMLQYLADIIFFWFTQTIKPLSFDHIERILKNEMYCLPFRVHKEVAKKLMVMYEECLQGNFSSVDILREKSLCSSDETTGIEEC